MRAALFILALAATAVAASASAADLTVVVRDAKGKPIPDAVITAFPGGKPYDGALKRAGPYRIVQQNLQFSPFVTVVPVGASVAFPNLDPVLHHVYSFSPAHPFQLKLYGKDQPPPVVFDKPGVIALGCNIHDQMIAFIDVVATPYVAKTGPDGLAHLTGVPEGPESLHLWHPYLKTKTGELVQDIILAAGGGSQSFSVELRPPPPVQSGGY